MQIKAVGEERYLFNVYGAPVAASIGFAEKSANCCHSTLNTNGATIPGEIVRGTCGG